MILRSLALMVTLIAIIPSASAREAGSDCAQDTIGLSPEYANGSSGAALGEARGQTFTARDTLLTFLRVWRVASQDSDWQIGMHPYITETDSTGAPYQYPDYHIVWEGPTLVIPDGDGIHPIEFKWTFDPPLALPHRGKYAFFLFQDPCLAHWDILATDQPWLYPDGDLFVTGRSSCRFIGRVNISRPYTTYDLVFQIGLCADAATAIHRTTWGRLKLLYR
jgi:hypothetical protein